MKSPRAQVVWKLRRNRQQLYRLLPSTLIRFAVGSSYFMCKYFNNWFKKPSRMSESPGARKGGNEYLHNEIERP